MNQNLDWHEMEQWLLELAETTAGDTMEDQPQIWAAALNEPQLRIVWWAGIYEQSEAEGARIETAARAMIRGEPEPPLTPGERARLAFRFQLASRLLRAVRQAETTARTGLLPSRVAEMNREEFLDWAVVVCWPVLAEVSDQTLTWANDLGMP